MSVYLTDEEFTFLKNFKHCFIELDNLKHVKIRKTNPTYKRISNGKTTYRTILHNRKVRKEKVLYGYEGEKAFKDFCYFQQISQNLDFLESYVKANKKLYLSILKRTFRKIDDYYKKNDSKTESFTGLFYEDDLINKSYDGIKYRSKSEMLIVMLLEQKHISVEYEKDLTTKDFRTYKPDFTLYNPLTDSYVYWEHFGLMTESEYREKATKKLNSYKESGIVEGKNLILTFENTNGGIDMQKISNQIDEMFFLASHKKIYSKLLSTK